MKRSSTGTGCSTAATAQCSSGELSRTQRGILSTLRKVGPRTESELYRSMPIRHVTMKHMQDSLHELELRHLVRCETQPNGRLIWGMA